jgi:hypothetical protein
MALGFGVTPPKERSEVRLGPAPNPPYTIFPYGQEVNVSYNFEMVSTTLEALCSSVAVGLENAVEGGTARATIDDAMVR